MSRARSFGPGGGAFVACLALVALARANPVTGQAPVARARLDTALVTVGDRLTLTVDVEHDPGASVVWPDSLDLAPFEVLDASAAPPTRAGERAVSTLRVTLTAFRLGELRLPSIPVVVAAADGDRAELRTDEFAVSVVSVGLDEGGEIREIRGPLSIPRGVFFLLPWLLLLVAVAALAWWARGRRGRAEEPATTVRLRAPHEIAFDALDELEASDLLERGEIKEYHIRVSEIVRGYVEARFRVPALEMTSPELVDALSRVGVEGDVLGDVRSFLGRCDLVKFAKLRPPSEVCRTMVSAARRIVAETRQMFDAAATGPDAAGNTGAAAEPGEHEPESVAGDAHAATPRSSGAAAAGAAGDHADPGPEPAGVGGAEGSA